MKSAYSALVFCLSLALHTMHAQTGGDPTSPPSGTPARTMKSLDQIEARTPLVDFANGVGIDPNGNITISESGSYYLTANLSVPSGDAITITASGVTLDLNGFTISSTNSSAGGTAISIDGSNVHITNGHIQSGTSYDSEAAGAPFNGTGFTDGINVLASGHSKLRICNIGIEGVAQNGIHTNDSSALVESCFVRTAGGLGIYSDIVRNCVVEQAGSDAISAAQVIDCRAVSVDEIGINCGLTGQVSNSKGVSNGADFADYGIVAGRVSNSTGISAAGYGIFADQSVIASYGSSTGSNILGAGGIGCSPGKGNVAHSTGIGTQYGIVATDGIVSYSVGESTTGNDAIICGIAVGCVIVGGTVDIDNKYNMP